MNQPDREIRSSVEKLIQLLAILHPPSSHPQEILTVYDFEQRYSTIGLNAQAQDEIARSRRLVETRKSYRLNGLGEFNIGLIFLYWGHCGTACTCFEKARQQWHFTNETASICLTYFAEGCAHYHAQQYEAAIGKFSRADQLFHRIYLPDPQTSNRFSQQLLSQLAAWQTLLRDLLLRPPIPDPPPAAQQAPSPEPLFDDDAPTKPHWQEAKETQKKQVNGFGQPIVNIGERPQQTKMGLPEIGFLDPARHRWYKVSKQDNGFLRSVPNGSWLLVTGMPTNHSFERGQLIVIEKAVAVAAGVRLLPDVADGRPRSLYLTEVPFNGRFLTPSPHGIELQLSSHPFKTIVYPQEMIGLVIGLWQAATAI